MEPVESNRATLTTSPIQAPNAPGRSATLLESGKYSDLTITVNERKWKVHKSVLCTQSEYFDKMCDGGFKESFTNECDLFDEDEYAVAAMIKFFYHQDYAWQTVLPFGCGTGVITLHVRVFALAQKYFVKSLEGLAFKKATEALAHWDKPDFAYAASEAFNFTQDRDLGTDLRRAFVTRIRANAATLFSSDEKYLVFQETFAAIPELMNEVIIDLANDSTTKSNYINRLSAAHKKVADDADKVVKGLKTEVEQLRSANSILRNAIADKPYTPQRAVQYGGPVGNWYRCPNCLTMFCRYIQRDQNWCHRCYSWGWLGKLNRSAMSMSGQDWQKYVVS